MCVTINNLHCTVRSFFSAHIPMFLYPFLHTSSKTRPFEYLRLTSLGVIGALVKVCVKNFDIFLLYYIIMYYYIIMPVILISEYELSSICGKQTWLKYLK